MSYLSVMFALLLFLPAPTLSVTHQKAQQDAGDSSRVVLRRPPDYVLESYRENSDYEYARSQAPALTWWEQLKQRFFDWLFGIFEDNGQGAYWKYALYVFAFVILIFAFLRFTRMEVGALFGRQRKDRPSPFVVSRESLEDEDLLLLADSAMQNGELRSAARLYYMHVLKALNDREAIKWTPRKTNQDYVMECRLESYKPALRRLTYLFDYFWYGDFPVDRQIVEEMRSLVMGIEST